MSTEVSEELDKALAHIGVKGMKWGVRRAEKQIAKGNATLAKADAKWQDRIYSTRGASKVHNNVIRRMRGREGDLAKIKNDPKYKGKDLTFASPLRDQYYQDIRVAYAMNTAKATAEVHGTSPSGRLKTTVVTNADKTVIGLQVEDVVVEHADTTENLLFIFKFDDEGFVVDAELAKGPMEHTGTTAELSEALEHYGTKGMRWGVRKNASGVIRGTEDHITARVLTNRARSKGTSHLTNAQLQAVVQRINLEQQYARLTHKPTKAEKARGYLKGALSAGKTVNEVIKFIDSPAGKILNQGIAKKTGGKPISVGNLGKFDTKTGKSFS
jgi:hypothetical protein